MPPPTVKCWKTSNTPVLPGRMLCSAPAPGHEYSRSLPLLATVYFYAHVAEVFRHGFQIISRQPHVLKHAGSDALPFKVFVLLAELIIVAAQMFGDLEDRQQGFFLARRGVTHPEHLIDIVMLRDGFT